MAEFKVGDKVVRKEPFRYGGWELECAREDKAADGVFQVEDLRPLTERITLMGLPGAWDESSFRLATGLEEHQDTGLSAEDRLRESDSHIECLRDLLAVEKQKVAELQAEVARCCGTVADKGVMEEKIATLLQLNNGLSEKLEAERARSEVFQSDLGGAIDLAKSLGEDLRVAREDVRWARFTRTHLSGICDALANATSDIDMPHTVSQLRLLAQMCEDQGNGADAALAYNAAQVVELTAKTLSALYEVQDYMPCLFPPMDAPLA